MQQIKNLAVPIDVDAFVRAVARAPLTATEANPILTAVLGDWKSEQAGFESEQCLDSEPPQAQEVPCLDSTRASDQG